MNIIASAGLFEDMREEDDDLGPMPDETETVFWQLVRQLLPIPVGNSGQCSGCSGWFDNWPGGVCDACRNNGNG